MIFILSNLLANCSYENMIDEFPLIVVSEEHVVDPVITMIEHIELTLLLIDALGSFIVTDYRKF